MVRWRSGWLRSGGVDKIPCCAHVRKSELKASNILGFVLNAVAGDARGRRLLRFTTPRNNRERLER